MKKNVSVLADNGQTILPCDVEVILDMANDKFINKHKNLEHRYSDEEVCDCFDISMAELERIRFTQSYEFNFGK